MLNIPRLQQKVVLAPHTTYQIGGEADYFFEAQTREELVLATREAQANGVPFFILGTGANILVGDKGFRGIVIKNQSKGIVFRNNFVTVESGATIADLIQITMVKGLSGLEHFAGIPSTVGGALYQNLHFLSPNRMSTYFIESVFESAEVLSADNQLSKVGKDFFKFGYDYSILHEKRHIVTKATFVLVPSDKHAIENQIRENLAWRNQKQPQLPESPSCGSVFKKIEGVGAGRLIEKVGLKGYSIGGAVVSEKHANYIVNKGGATAQNVLDLINLIQDKVRTETGYSLTPEISFIGEF